MLLDKVIEIMTRRVHEGGATDYSRLAWLLVNNNQENLALEMVKKGLKIDQENHYCKKLYDKLYV